VPKKYTCFFTVVPFYNNLKLENVFAAESYEIKKYDFIVNEKLNLFFSVLTFV
jgi:hypothetical protein